MHYALTVVNVNIKPWKKYQACLYFNLNAPLINFNNYDFFKTDSDIFLNGRLRTTAKYMWILPTFDPQLDLFVLLSLQLSYTYSKI